MRRSATLFLASLVLVQICAGQPFDAAPFGLPLPEGNGILWEDPREIHQVVVHFATNGPLPKGLRLEYWGSRWPDQHLPKDREPGGADVGWMELGNWYKGGWRVADAEQKRTGRQSLSFFIRSMGRNFRNLRITRPRFDTR